MSFHVIFQCKKYQGSVSAGAIRDFRGAMVGRADKGLFITTGTFTPAAVKEATRDGAPPIDLVDGDELAEKLKQLGLGINREMVEKVTVDDVWFKNL
jgi:restriction system protein